MAVSADRKPVLEALFEASRDEAEYVKGFFRRMADVMDQVDPEAVAEVVRLIDKAQVENKSIFFIANGGSAAVASHIVNDLCVNTLVGSARGFRAFSLTDNVESITAVANDSGYENVFSYQLQCNMQPGDVLVALSVSGNSENIIRAVDWANENGGLTIGWSGFGGGRLAERAKVSIHIPSTRDEYGPVEDLFSNLGHVVTGYLKMKRGGRLYH